MPSFNVFTRAWWRENPEWPDGLEPDGNAPRTYLARNVASEGEAREIARRWNKAHNPGRLAIKAEIEAQAMTGRRGRKHTVEG